MFPATFIVNPLVVAENIPLTGPVGMFVMTSAINSII